MPKPLVARAKRLTGDTKQALEDVDKASRRRDGKTVDNYLELGHCHVAAYAARLATASLPSAGSKEAKQWNNDSLSSLLDAHQAFESAWRKLERVGGHVEALRCDALVLEEVFLFQQLTRLDEVAAAAKKEEKNVAAGFVAPQEEIDAICKGAGNFEKLSGAEQLKCLEEECAPPAHASMRVEIRSHPAKPSCLLRRDVVLGVEIVRVCACVTGTNSSRSSVFSRRPRRCSRCMPGKPRRCTTPR